MKTEEEIRKELEGYDETERDLIMDAMQAKDWAARAGKLTAAITLSAWRATLKWVLEEDDDD